MSDVTTFCLMAAAIFVVAILIDVAADFLEERGCPYPRAIVLLVVLLVGAAVGAT